MFYLLTEEDIRAIIEETKYQSELDYYGDYPSLLYDRVLARVKVKFDGQIAEEINQEEVSR